MSSNVSRSTDAAASGPLYAAHEKIYPREVHGRFQRLRLLALAVILGGFYLLPWISWQGRQLLLFDLPARRFHILWMTFYPQDFIYLALLLVMGAVTLLFFTALGGRLWCGYTCPQTLWTELFLLIERHTEGDRARRMKLDAGPWTRQKVLRKGIKHSLWILLALWTGFTFVGYFTPIRELAVKLATFELGGWESFWIGFYGFATWGNAGFMREQVCLYMCPYARFQGAMLDRNSLIVSYDAGRGEPRGGRRRGVSPAAAGLGECIDCNLCVQVCPTGIDIRNGLQYECINCASCVDVCDSVMDRMQYPRGLIRYTTENALEGRPTRIVRPRVILYGLILLLIAGGLAFSLLTRNTVTFDVLRDRNALYRVVDGDWIENSYTLKITNRAGEPLRLTLDATGVPGAEAQIDPAPLEVAPGAVATAAARVRVPRAVVSGGSDIGLQLTTAEGEVLARRQTRLLAPTR